MTTPPDIIIIGGGFSGLATLANLVREGQRPFSVAVVSRDPQGVFGPAYSTKRPEHLLNVRAKNMGFLADDHGHFYNWTKAQGIKADKDDYLPRVTYAKYLTAMLDDTLALAKEKGITIDWRQGEAQDIEDAGGKLSVQTDNGKLAAKAVVLAIGNTLKAQTGPSPNGLVHDPWHFDFSKLAKTEGALGVIGSGLTAVDTIISILDAGWRCKIACFSGSGLFPRPHTPTYDYAQRVAFAREDFKNHRLSGVLHGLRAPVKNGMTGWQYAVDSLRPLTQDIWHTFSDTDKRRLIGKYFTLWNVHRHRCAPALRHRIDDAQEKGQLRVVKTRVKDVKADGNGVALSLQNGEVERFAYAFQCAGVNYDTGRIPLLKNLLARNLAQPATSPFGIAADHQLVYSKGGSTLYALGSPLFGHLFETTAVPELRVQANVIARNVLENL